LKELTIAHKACYILTREYAGFHEQQNINIIKHVNIQTEGTGDGQGI
jgi:hypothetical protein